MDHKAIDTDLVGVLSDTHGQVTGARQAARAFAAHGIRYVFHGGDIGGQGVVHALGKFSVAYVAGNTDWNHAGLESLVQAAGSRFDPLWLETSLGGKRLALTHGHDAPLLQHLIESGRYDYVLHGHTHAFRDERLGSTHVVNPGAIFGVFPPTAAIIDLKADTVERLVLEESA